MKAEPGKRYTQIVDGVCRWKFDITMLPEWADGAFLAVDITGFNPEPDEGDVFDGASFIKPVPPPAPAPVPRPRFDIVDQILALPPERRALLKAELTKP
jgi:hypothetical protein